VRVGLRRILFLAKAEALHLVRDRASLVQILIAPVIQLLILSNAATFSIENTPTYVVDYDRTSTSRGLVERFAASGHFRIIGASSSIEQAQDLLLHGEVTMVITLPLDFEKSLVRAGSAHVQLVVNAEKGTAAGIVQSYAGRILNDYSRELSGELRPNTPVLTAQTVQLPPRRATPHIDVTAQSWYNPTLNYKHYMVPGILVSLVTMIGTLLTAQNIAREKELGTLEQLNVTPITRGQFIAAKLLPFWVLAMLDLSIGLAVGKFVFGIPIRGSLLLLMASAGLYLTVALGVGLWISTMVETQQQAMFVTFFILMIYLLMSGLFTPIESMPRWVQIVAELNPVRHFVAISRAILVKGAGIPEIAPRMGVLIGMGAFALTMAVRAYRKQTA
jgi:ABC-2 type transport system permease protein